MKIVKFDLFILGIVSDKSNLLVAKGLKGNFDPKFSLCLFCDYSQHEIQIGSKFDSLINLKTQKEYSLNATLIDVTQQWAIPFDLIPMGSKTILRFMFSQEDLKLIKDEIPYLDSWSNSTITFKLVAYEF